MKKIFLYLRRKIMDIPSIAWVDLDKGQLNNYEARPAIDFPAVLLKIDYPRTTKLSRNQQQCDVHITLSIVFDFMDDTSNITPDDILQTSLSVFDICQEVHEALQGEIHTEVIRSPLERASVRDTTRNDRLKVLQYTYITKTIE